MIKIAKELGADAIEIHIQVGMLLNEKQKEYFLKNSR